MVNLQYRDFGLQLLIGLFGKCPRPWNISFPGLETTPRWKDHISQPRKSTCRLGMCAVPAEKPAEDGDCIITYDQDATAKFASSDKELNYLISKGAPIQHNIIPPWVLAAAGWHRLCLVLRLPPSQGPAQANQSKQWARTGAHKDHRSVVLLLSSMSLSSRPTSPASYHWSSARVSQSSHCSGLSSGARSVTTPPSRCCSAWRAESATWRSRTVTATTDRR